ncbi:hypothetical protein BD560DRAFT_382976 [Blakeslea trispora]|nr:hypothetical protein BD560DRAFT_382976 [Blakeslea trispora]
MTPIVNTVHQQIVDSHVHFWHPDQVYVSWINKEDKELFRRKDAEEYTQLIKKSNGSVQVKAGIYVETDVDPCHGLVEADWIAHYVDQIKLTTEFGGIHGIVAFAPVYQGSQVRNYLNTLMKLLKDKKPLLKGVRYLLQDPCKDPNRILDTTFVQGIQVLAEYGLCFDLTINCNEHPEQFPPLQQLVSQCPKVKFVLDHMAKPPCDSQPGDKQFEFWKQQIIQLAQNPNVYCKVSGLLTEIKQTFPKDIVSHLAPFVQVVRQSFGVDRLMFGGDWPIVELSLNRLNWHDWYRIVSDIVQPWSAEEKHKLFALNAAQFYDLSL